MSRDLDNLRRVFHKLQDRYGDDDAIVLQLKSEIDSRESIEVKHSSWFATYRECLSKRMWWSRSGTGSGNASKPSGNHART
jgi:hypothetical protein